MQKELEQIKQKASNLTEEEITELCKVMYRTFNFINTLENMDIAEVNKLQDSPKENNISMTSKELMDTFERILDMDIE